MILSQSGRWLFNAATITASGTDYQYTHNEGSTAASFGWVPIKADHIWLQTCVATLTTGTLTYRVEGKSNTLDRAASIAVVEVTAAGVIDTLLEISQKLSHLRVGARIFDTSATNIFYAGVNFTEIK